MMNSTTAKLWGALHNLEIAANTVEYAYRNRPENFALALQSLKEVTDSVRVVLAATKNEALL